MRKYTLYKLLAVILTVSFLIPVHAKASMPDVVSPKESAYLATYSAYVYPAGNGKIQVYYDVTGTHMMEDIGALSVKIYESNDNSNWRWVRSYTNRDTSSMLGHNTRAYGSHVDYQGVAGRYYRAYVCVWAGRDGGGDRRYFWTDSRIAK